MGGREKVEGERRKKLKASSAKGNFFVGGHRKKKQNLFAPRLSFLDEKQKKCAFVDVK